MANNSLSLIGQTRDLYEVHAHLEAGMITTVGLNAATHKPNQTRCGEESGLSAVSPYTDQVSMK